MKTFQFTVYLGKNGIEILNLDEFKELLVLNKSKTHNSVENEISAEALVDTKNLGFQFALGKINSKSKENAEEALKNYFK